jgi:membrane-associated protein
MSEAITQLVEGAMASWWVFPALFAFAAIDGFFPAVPAESLVVTAGVFSAGDGEPALVLIILAATLGAFAGDHVSYFLGRAAGRRVHQDRGRKASAFRWAGKMLDERGGMIIVVCRYIPGARTAVTLTAGAVRYPLRTFSAFDAIAALSWGTYSALIGYAGGQAFEDDPLKGVAVGLGLAIAVAGGVELIRHLRRRRFAEAPC